MHMPNLTRRTQILLDEPRFQRLQAEAAASGASVAELIRNAIDQTYPHTSRQRGHSAAEFLAEATGSPLESISQGDLKNIILSGMTPAETVKGPR